MEVLSKKTNLRVISVDSKGLIDKFSIKSVSGGYLYQDKDCDQGELKSMEVVTRKKPTKLDYSSIELGWKLVRNVKSNAIVFANHNQLLGVGAGQMSRIDSVKIAIQKVTESGLNLKGGIMASDAFFPFSDGINTLIKAGVKTIIQPGGSIRDQEIIDAANKAKIKMFFTNIRHFSH